MARRALPGSITPALLDQYTLDWVYRLLRRNSAEGIVGMIRESARVARLLARERQRPR